MILSKSQILDSCSNVQWMRPEDCVEMAILYRVLSERTSGKDKKTYRLLADMFEAKSKEEMK